jgi:hypothetical protein
MECKIGNGMPEINCARSRNRVSPPKGVCLLLPNL